MGRKGVCSTRCRPPWFGLRGKRLGAGVGESGVVFLERGHGKGGGFKALGEAVDSGDEAFADGGDGETVEDGFGANFEAIANVVGAGAGGVDDPIDLFCADEVDGIGMAFADAEERTWAEAVLPEGGGGATGGVEVVTEGREAFGGFDAGGFIGVTEGKEDGGGATIGAGHGEVCAGGRLALEVG